MTKVAIIGKQQPIIIRKKIKEYLEANGLKAEILEMPTRNVLDWAEELKEYSAIISAESTITLSSPNETLCSVELYIAIIANSSPVMFASVARDLNFSILSLFNKDKTSFFIS